jgi:hypothetical protein
MIWEELNTTSEHREKVIEWLDTLIMANLTEELTTMTGKLHEQVVVEAYNTLKGLAMKRYIKKRHYAPCPIDKAEIQEHFHKTWAPESQSFIPAAAGSPLFLAQKIPDDADEEMKEFMLNEKKHL